MLRIEIIANQSVQDDVIENLSGRISGFEYTLIPGIQGRGIKTAKLGDTTWPELNFVLFSYLSEDNAKIAKKVMEAVIKRFPNEGISYFFTQAVEL